MVFSTIWSAFEKATRRFLAIDFSFKDISAV